MLNSILYEIRYKQGVSSLALIEGFLRKVTFSSLTDPMSRNYQSWHRHPITSATVWVEQSFSDFGDLDVLFLLEKRDELETVYKQAVLLEAKVQTCQNAWRNISAEWARFAEVLRRPNQTDVRRLKNSRRSNLFVQLYRKSRLVEKLSNNVDVRDGFLIPRGSLGDNEVVNRAADVLAEFCGDAWFVALVPDPPASLTRFFDQLHRFPLPADLPALNTERWGYLSWKTVSEFCRQQAHNGEPALPDACENFRFNEGQIYDESVSAPNIPPDRSKSGVSMIRLDPGFAAANGGFPNPQNTYLYFSWSQTSGVLRNYYTLPMQERRYPRDQVLASIRVREDGQKDEVLYPRNGRRPFEDEAWWRDETHNLNETRLID